jgi:sulfonate transport system permease protein
MEDRAVTAAVMQKRSLRGVRALLVPLVLAGAWHLLSQNAARAYVFVPLEKVARSALELLLNGELFWNVLASLRKTLSALVLGGMAGLGVGTALAASDRFERAFGPSLHAFRQVPGLGLAPLIGLWFGTGELAKLLLIFLAVFYPVLLSTYAGVRAIDVRYLEVARVYALPRSEVFRKVMLPAMLPYLHTGLSQAVAFAWLSTIGSEMLLTSGAGVGNLMQHAQAGGRMDVVIVCVIAVGTLSMSMDHLLQRLGNHLMLGREPSGASA